MQSQKQQNFQKEFIQVKDKNHRSDCNIEWGNVSQVTSSTTTIHHMA